ncbi:unnamed protein product [Pieris brassicae]|uniref:Cytochrome c oxidase subunit 7C, mitochondrial n=1 Tax=Pieris brassicae TaxID=7116 RepID=A0A9P0THS6_PIEBR|nr:unnamed protein product [Pieris brassicae]
MLGVVTRSSLLGSNVMKTFIRNGSHGGVPGENLPFNIHNRTRLTVNFFFYILTGISAPFVITAYQMKK